MSILDIYQLLWAVLSDEQMRKILPFSLLNDEQMSNKVGVKHQPASSKVPPRGHDLKNLVRMMSMDFPGSVSKGWDR